ncbi:methyltransferase [Candidatus Woesearchaeota archaeon]|nr:methyltransferase [Candidatus Woesearchaeota archaeon]
MTETKNCSIYEPKEDSVLLKKYVVQYAEGNVLDMGTGSGIQAIAAVNCPKVKSVLAVDIQEDVIKYCKKNIKNEIHENRRFSGHKKSKLFSCKIKFMVSDLFEALKKRNLKNKKFDTIIFNAPYLPSELKVKDLTIEGGKKGYEVIEKFLNEANNFLSLNGIILLAFSSLTKMEKVNEFIRNNLLEYEILEKQHYFFEDIYVCLIKKSKTLKELEQSKIKKIRFFAKGKRGLVFTGIYKNKKIAIKIKNPESEAILRIDNEIKNLKLLNKHKIGPKLLLMHHEFFVYEFIDGINIIDFLASNKNKKTVLKALKSILSQLFVMDKLKINKEEMSHPVKHILINKKTIPILIDFERAHYAFKPSNVTQFCDFLISENISKLLKEKGIILSREKIINAARKYKGKQNKRNFENIVALDNEH